MHDDNVKSINVENSSSHEDHSGIIQALHSHRTADKVNSNFTQ